MSTAIWLGEEGGNWMSTAIWLGEEGGNWMSTAIWLRVGTFESPAYSIATSIADKFMAILEEQTNLIAKTTEENRQFGVCTHRSSVLLSGERRN